jgi:cytochrome c
MFTSEARKVWFVAGLVTTVLFVGCSATHSSYETVGKNVDGAVKYPRKNGHYTAYAINDQNLKGFHAYGRTPTPNEIKAWDVDVMPDGTGLPEGQGSVEMGDELYHEQCATCHGDFGSGGKGYPPLEGGHGTLSNQLGLEGTEGPRKTIGSYWPYASTLFWYIKTAMPFPNPKSLSSDEVYAITAYLLSVNEITVNGKEMDDEFVLGKHNFSGIKMNNEDGFYPVHPDRKDLKEQRVPLAQGERCMSNCNQPKPVNIKAEIDTGFDPAISTIKSWPKENSNSSANSVQASTYETYCSACHANEAIGAPVVGDKEAWSEVLEKQLSEVYANGINGIGAMPAKGGAVDLSDEQFKEIVDYMINLSK